MRPINFKLKAFGSFADSTEINFEDGLGDKKIFLIHGKTGSGKTTLLDAICYALYEESSGGDRKKDDFHSEFADDNQAMSVEFNFAMNDSAYKIKRVPAVKKGAKKLVELYKDNSLLASDAKDANQYIKNLLGFDAAQFRQVVILPQGKFREFLTATSQKREELLSVIFNAGFYAKVEKELENKKSGVKTFEDKLKEKEREADKISEKLLENAQILKDKEIPLDKEL